MAFRKHLSGQKGFTLIELLVVVAILGILATVAFPRIMGAIDNARERKALADMTVLRDALERFYLDYGVFPICLEDLQTQNYVDPGFEFTNSYGNVYFYAVPLDGDYSAATAAPAATDLKDYVLGDPGQVPPATIALADAGGVYSPEGTAIGGVFYWGTPTLNAGVMAGGYIATDLDGSTITLIADPVTVLNPNSKPTGTWVKFSGQ